MKTSSRATHLKIILIGIYLLSAIEVGNSSTANGLAIHSVNLIDDYLFRAATARSLPEGMTSGEKNDFTQVVKYLKAGNKNAVEKGWGNLVKSMKQRRVKRERITQVLYLALRKAYLEVNKDLRVAADKVRYWDERGKETAKDPNEQARIDLAIAMQKQSRLNQAIAEMMKKYHDTMKAIITNLGA